MDSIYGNSYTLEFSILGKLETYFSRCFHLLPSANYLQRRSSYKKKLQHKTKRRNDILLIYIRKNRNKNRQKKNAINCRLHFPLGNLWSCILSANVTTKIFINLISFN